MRDTSERIGDLATAAINLLVEAVEQTPEQNWDQPSTMDGWSVRELVGHATGSAAKVVALVENRAIWGRSEPADWVNPDPAGRLRQFAVQLREALPGTDLDAPRVSPGGEVPLRDALRYPIADLAMHSWDVHHSQGRLVELPADLLEYCDELLATVPEERLRRPGGFGPARPAPADATPTTRLMAHLGRTVTAQH